MTLDDQPGPSGGIFTPALLDACISCGFCLPACPTYAETKDEASSPRGRITLMRALEAGVLPPDDPTLAEQASQCLGCRACEPVCPAGVQYGQLLEEWRDHQWDGRQRPLVVRALTLVVSRRWLVRLMGRLRRPAPGGGRSGPWLMLGCFERALFPRVSRAALRLRPELTAPDRQGCCGALHAHNGDSATGERLARELGRDLPGHIVTTAGGCAAHLSHVLGRDRVSELSEYLVANAHVPAARVLAEGRPARVGLQDSCHLRNGMNVTKEPRQLLREVSEYVELASAGTCCGAAGTYSLLRPKESRAILAAKLDEIEAAKLDYIVVLNPGCQRQLQTGVRRRRLTTRVLHLAEILDRAQDQGSAAME